MLKTLGPQHVKIHQSLLASMFCMYIHINIYLILYLSLYLFISIFIFMHMYRIGEGARGAWTSRTGAVQGELRPPVCLRLHPLVAATVCGPVRQVRLRL